VLCRADSVGSLPVVRLQVDAANQINVINNFFPSLCGCLQASTVLCFQELGSFPPRCQLSFPCIWCPPALAVRDRKRAWPGSRRRAVHVRLWCMHTGVLPLPRCRHTLSPALDLPGGMPHRKGGARWWGSRRLGSPGAPAPTWGHRHPPAGGESRSVAFPCCWLGGDFCSATGQEGPPGHPPARERAGRRAAETRQPTVCLQRRQTGLGARFPARTPHPNEKAECCARPAPRSGDGLRHTSSFSKNATYEKE